MWFLYVETCFLYTWGSQSFLHPCLPALFICLVWLRVKTFSVTVTLTVCFSCVHAWLVGQQNCHWMKILVLRYGHCDRMIMFTHQWNMYFSGHLPKYNLTIHLSLCICSWLSWVVTKGVGSTLAVCPTESMNVTLRGSSRVMAAFVRFYWRTDMVLW